jgi:hypothetical protein
MEAIPAETDGIITCCCPVMEPQLPKKRKRMQALFLRNLSTSLIRAHAASAHAQRVSGVHSDRLWLQICEWCNHCCNTGSISEANQGCAKLQRLECQ